MPQNFINFRCHGTGCWFAYNFLISKRQALISRQDQAMTYSNWSILRISQNMTLCERQTPENIENAHIAQRHSFEQLSLSRYYSSVQPLYESLLYLRSGRSVVFQRPRCSFPGVSRLEKRVSSSSEASIFAPEIHHFRQIGDHQWPWISQIRCQINFPRHRGLTTTFLTYQSPNWRTDIANDRWDPEQWPKTSKFPRKILPTGLSGVWPTTPPRGTALLGR